MSKKRVYYPIDKNKIQYAIDKYLEYMKNDDPDAWSDAYNACNEISPGSTAWMCLIHVIQACYYSNTLDVEHIYEGILALGINTKLEDYYGD